MLHPPTPFLGQCFSCCGPGPCASESPEKLATHSFPGTTYCVVSGVGPGNLTGTVTSTQTFLCSREVRGPLLYDVFHHPYPQVLPTRFQIYSNLPILTKNKLPSSNDKLLLAPSFSSPSQRSATAIHPPCSLFLSSQ